METKDPKKSILDSKMIKIKIEEYEKDIETKSDKEKNVILDLLTNSNHLHSDEELDEIKDDLHEACRKSDIDLIKILLSETIQNESIKFTFKIDKVNQTASLFKVNNYNEEVIIPRAFEHESTEYLITSIYGIKNKNINRIKFVEESAVKTIYKSAFSCSIIKEIYFPASLKELKEGWCCFTSELKKIKISSSNDQFKIIDDKYLVGKSQINNDEFDTLLFAFRDIKEISIPSNIRIISSCAFNHCVNLTKVDIPTNSNLQTIESNAFSFSNIEEIYFPASLKDLKEGWCCFTGKLTKIKISPSNDRFKIIDGKYLVGKSQLNNDEFDTLLFAFRDIEEISIPSNIKIISSYAFNGCKKLTKVDIQTNSNLQTIESNAFSFSNIEEIYFPASLKDLKEGWCCFTSELKKIKISSSNDQFKIIDDKYLVGKSQLNNDEFDTLLFAFRDIEDISIPSNIKIISSYAFDTCKNLTKVGFLPYSNLQIITSSTFSFSNITEISIPSTVSKICKHAFCACQNLTKVIIPPNSNLQTIESYAFSFSNIKEIFIPSKVSKICEDAFSRCKNLERVEFAPNSNLQTIESKEFEFSNIKKIVIPPTVSKIGEDAFSFCSNLISVELAPNSNLQTIESYAFSNSKIKGIFIPPKVSKICKNAFNSCLYLQIIEISDEYKLKTFQLPVFNRYASVIIMVPSSLDILIE